MNSPSVTKVKIAPKNERMNLINAAPLFSASSIRATGTLVKTRTRGPSAKIGQTPVKRGPNTGLAAAQTRARHIGNHPSLNAARNALGHAKAPFGVGEVFQIARAA